VTAALFRMVLIAFLDFVNRPFLQQTSVFNQLLFARFSKKPAKVARAANYCRLKNGKIITRNDDENEFAKNEFTK
jgi:hypothetical protein